MSKLRPLSPYSYFQEFNKKACQQNQYPKSQNTQKLMWNLNHQQFSQFMIPKSFIDRHLANQNNRIDFNDKDQSQDSNEKEHFLLNSYKQHIEYLKNLHDSKRIDFIDHNQKKAFSLSKFQTQSVKSKNNKNSADRKNITLMKVLSSFPLQKLETLCDQKEVQANLLISPKNSTSQRKFIKAKKVKSLNKPIGQFLALAESTKKNLGTNSKKPKKLNAVKSQTVIKEMRKLDFFVKEESEKVQDIENGSQNQENEYNYDIEKQQFRIRSQEELERLKVYFGQEDDEKQIKMPEPSLTEKQSKLTQEKQERQDKQERQERQIKTEHRNTQSQNLASRLNQKLRDERINTEEVELDDKKFFFNYNKYFRTNYAYHGVNTQLSKMQNYQIERFENYVQDLIQQ